jgi:hypothetical protein
MEQLDGVADDLIVVPLEVSHLLRHVHPEMLGHLDVVPVHTIIAVPGIAVTGGSAAEKVETFTGMAIVGLDPGPVRAGR